MAFSISATTAYNGYNTSLASLSGSLKKMSSGSRINSAADDAAGLAISVSMRGQISGLNKATQNAQNSVSQIQTAEGGLSSSSDILTRMKELATQASNGTYSSEDRAALNSEFEQLKGELDNIAGTTNYNGANLLDGSRKNGSTGVRIGDMSSEALGLKDINLSSVDSANTALSAIDAASEYVSSTRGDLGAVQNSLESTVNTLYTSMYNTAASESSISDLDMAKESINLMTQKIMAQAGISMQAQTMSLMRQNALALLVR